MWAPQRMPDPIAILLTDPLTFFGLRILSAQIKAKDRKFLALFKLFCIEMFAQNQWHIFLLSCSHSSAPLPSACTSHSDNTNREFPAPLQPPALSVVYIPCKMYLPSLNFNPDVTVNKLGGAG